MAIRLIATGGTIASLADPETGAVRPAVSAEALVAGVPALEELGPVQVEELAAVSGWNVTPETMLAVSRRVGAAVADDEIDGVIVTHGTDTIEETAFLCDVTVPGDKPVAFVGAMRGGDELGAEGPRNLVCGARVVRADAARGLGAVLVLNDEVHAARWVRKQDSFRASAFSSPGHGPLGVVTPGWLRLTSCTPARHVLPRPERLDRPVPIVQTYTGMDEELIDAVLDVTGAAGLVVEGTGLGNVPAAPAAAIARAVSRGLPVVIATRAPSGGTRPVYGGPGGGVTLREQGVIGAGGLSAAKARLLLMLLLAGTDGGDVRRDFEAAVDALG
jgi:L-asparaginase